MTQDANLDARMLFSAVGATPAAAIPAIPAKPHIITINGKEFQITQVRMKIDGTWKDIDIKTLSDSGELGELTDRCKKIFEKAKPTTNQLSKLSFTFEQNMETESFLSSTVGIYWTRFKNPPVAMNLKQIEFQSEGAAEPEVYKLEEAELDEAAKAKLQNDFKEDLRGVAQFTKMLLEKEHIKSKPKKPAIERSPLHQVITDSIKDAGSTENRCASLSLAKNELDKKISIETIVAKYKLPPELIQTLKNENDIKKRTQLLSNALIKKAASVIERKDSNPFHNLSIANTREPCLQAIENALLEHKKIHPDFQIEAIREKKAVQYANLIREPNTMLDLPFFLALEQPFIILQKTSDNTNYEIRVIGHLFNIPGTIETCNLDNVNIVYYNGTNHYQSIILASDQSKAAIRHLLTKNIKEQIESLSTRLNDKNMGIDGQVLELKDYEDLIRLYPRAKEEILQKFQLTQEAKTALVSATDLDFTRTLRRNIHQFTHAEDVD